MEWIKVTFLMIEYLAVAIIAGITGYSIVRYFFFLLTKKNEPGENYRQYKHTLGAGLLLGLEILVAADVIRTVTLEPNLENFAALGLLVVVRTFLSWALVVEIEGRWPWQPKHASAESGAHAK